MPCVYGTDLARKLRSLGYGGLLIIRSADAMVEDSARFMEEGFVDGCVGKDSSGVETTEQVQNNYLRKLSSK